MTKWIFKALLCLVFMGFIGPASPEAQQPADKNSITSFVNSVASTVYSLAWPTATYRGVRVDDIQSVPGGYDVLTTLWGLSGIDGSDLWVQLVIELRSDGLHDIRVRRDNAFWVAPFETVKTLGKALVEMQQQYNRDHPAATPTAPAAPVQPAPTAPAPNAFGASSDPSSESADTPSAGGTCLTNPTSETIVFSYHWGDVAWTAVSLDPGKTFRMVWNYVTLRTTPVLSVKYDSDFAPGYQEQKYDLENLPAVDREDCSRMKNYHFKIADTKILLYEDK